MLLLDLILLLAVMAGAGYVATWFAPTFNRWFRRQRRAWDDAKAFRRKYGRKARERVDHHIELETDPKIRDHLMRVRRLVRG